MESFQKDFEILRELGQETFVLRGSTLLVEILPREEIKTSGGLIISTPKDHTKGGSVTAHAVEIGRVLMSGQGYWNEEKANPEGYLIPKGGYDSLECQPGAIVVLPQYSITLMSHFPAIQRPTENKIAMVKMDQVLMYFPSVEAYETAKAKLKS
jgi:hypothetical protein